MVTEYNRYTIMKRRAEETEKSGGIAAAELEQIPTEKPEQAAEEDSERKPKKTDAEKLRKSRK